MENNAENLGKNDSIEELKLKLPVLSQEVNSLIDRKINGENIDSELEKKQQELNDLINKIREVNALKQENLELSNVEPEQKEFYGDSKVEKSDLETVNKSKISTSFDLRGLTQNLNEIGDIIAPDGYVYKKDYLIDTIVNLKGSNDENLKKVTNIYGLRDKVKELLLRKELNI